MPTTKACQLCGASFSRPTSTAPRARYCSVACSAEGRRRRVTIACERCGERFEVEGHRRGQRYCSTACRDAARFTQLPVECEGCGRTFTVKRSHAGQTRCCSVACLRALTAARQTAPKRCTRCAAVKPAADFLRRASGALRSECRACGRAASSGRRARLLSVPGDYTPGDVVRLWHRQRGECAGCGCRIGKRPSERAFHVDHVLPLSRPALGPTNSPDKNLQLLCPPCNLSKCDRTMSEWRHRRPGPVTRADRGAVPRAPHDGGSPSTPRYSPLPMTKPRRIILDTITEAGPKGADLSDLYGAPGVGSSPANVRQLVMKLHRDGLLRRLDRGRYAASGVAPDAPLAGPVPVLDIALDGGRVVRLVLCALPMAA